MESPSPQAQVVREPILKQRLTTGEPHSKVVNCDHTYLYEVVHAVDTRQFVVTDMPELVKPPQRAIKLKLKPKKVVTVNTAKYRELPAAKTINHMPPETLLSRQIKPDQASRTLTVFFALNSCALTPHEIKKLRDFIHGHRLRQAQQVEVIGYTCWLGSKKYNQSLALKRARAVALRLKKAGVTIRSVSGKGKCCYIDRKHPAPNRRAEVTVVCRREGILPLERR